ncbi:thiol:disulfide interchange protein DsbA/DsbL [Lysobacter capsici]|uniref:thiol:disulfide interchange protein DsbA/DsbL n=1 Tax=Lysobacter capsici TaxID=435897 RepID=UPI000BBAC651|nr:thiol:disulfide interchange protein DsbA/DsbL [Lysobacter capsici]ATE70282.1 dihydroneopterin aldolase [Lysobacter capsici]
MNLRLATLLLLAVLPFAASAAPKAAAASAAPVVGVDYVEIEGGKPFAPVKGKIEVVEVFGYTCPHCAHFEPQVAAWKAKLPSDVNFVPLAAPFGGYWNPYAQAFYTAQALKLVPKTHEAVFKALHEERSLPIQNASAAEIASFYAKFGADPIAFAAAMNGPATAKAMDRAKTFIMASEVDSTPSMVVAGKYRIITQKGFDDMLRVADGLIAKERAAAKR